MTYSDHKSNDIVINLMKSSNATIVSDYFKVVENITGSNAVISFGDTISVRGIEMVMLDLNEIVLDISTDSKKCTDWY